MEQALTVLQNLYQDPLLAAFFVWTDSQAEQDFYAFLQTLYQADAQDDFSKYLEEKIIYDVNAFSLACGKKKKLSPFVENAFAEDLYTLCALLNKLQAPKEFAVGNTFLTVQKDVARYVKKLKKFYARYGYGDFIRYRAFTFENGALRGVQSPSPVRLCDLKDYEDEKKLIGSNIEHFLQGLPYSNMLLYGERGTGKSSTVHAMLNEYFSEGLRLVELSKENMLQISRLKESLKNVPLKFMIYIDDLSLSAGDERISSLKAALEGCSEGHTENAMIVATSNRRHLIDEKFSQRQDSVHAGDSMQEELSLSDRFGISVLFTSTNKAQYLSIVDQLARDIKLTMPEPELHLLAERWAIVKGGRSPRRAKQFVNLAYSLTSKGMPVVF